MAKSSYFFPKQEQASIYKHAAEVALRELGKPATVQEIVAKIYAIDHLKNSIRGKTPHKTISARLSTDIRNNGPATKFYRVGPSTFALKELKDKGLYEDKSSQLFIGRDRKKEVSKTPVLCISADEFPPHLEGKAYFKDLLPVMFWRRFKKHFSPQKEIDHSKFYQIKVFVIVRFENEVICYEPTSYDERHLDFLGHHSIGIQGSLYNNDCDLFDESGIGITNASIREFRDFFYFDNSDLGKAIKNVSYLASIFQNPSITSRNVRGIISIIEMKKRLDLPDNTLGVRNLRWMKLDYTPNSFSTFDTWSKYGFRYLNERLQKSNV